MSHKADGKAFRSKGFTHHVVNHNFAVAGFKDEKSAIEDAEKRNDKALKLGIKPAYSVEEILECTYVDSK